MMAITTFYRPLITLIVLLSYSLESNSKAVLQEEEAEATPDSLTQGFGGILAEGLVGNVLSPQTGDVRDFLRGFAENLALATGLNNIFSSTTTSTTTTRPLIFKSHSIPESSDPQSAIVAPIIPNRQVPIVASHQPIQNEGLSQLTSLIPLPNFILGPAPQRVEVETTTKPALRFPWGGDGGAVQKFVSGLVTGFNQFGRVGPPQSAQPQDQQQQGPQNQGGQQSPIIYVVPQQGENVNPGNGPGNGTFVQGQGGGNGFEFTTVDEELTEVDTTTRDDSDEDTARS